MNETKHTPICFQCGKQGQMFEFRRDGKLLNWCFPCIEKTAWKILAALKKAEVA